MAVPVQRNGFFSKKQGVYVYQELPWRETVNFEDADFFVYSQLTGDSARVLFRLFVVMLFKVALGLSKCSASIYF